MCFPYRHHRKISKRAKKTDTHSHEPLHFWHSSVLSDSISSPFAVPFLSLSSEFAQHFALGSLARAAPNRDNHLTLEFIIASESMQKKRQREKKCPPMCSLFYTFAEFLHSLRIRMQTYVSALGMLISTKGNCSGFQTVSMASRRRRRRLHSRFIYDAMNSLSAKMDIRFAESTVISWSCSISITICIANTSRRKCQPWRLCFIFIAISMPCTRLCCVTSAASTHTRCDDGNLFELT